MPSPGTTPEENPAWNLLDVFVVLTLALVSFLFIGPVVAGMARVIPRFHGAGLITVTRNPFVALTIQAVGYLALVSFMVITIRLRSKRRDFASDIGWNRPSGSVAVKALAGGAAMSVGSMLISALLSKWIPKSMPVQDMFRETNSAYLMAAFAVLAAPLVEELFFRGFLYPALARPLSRWPAILITAAAFAVIHSPQLANSWAALMPLLAVGLTLTTVRAVAKSVAVCVLMHMGYNGLIMALMLLSTRGFHDLRH